MQDALCDKYWTAMISLIGFTVVYIVCQARCKVVNSEHMTDVSECIYDIPCISLHSVF